MVTVNSALTLVEFVSDTEAVKVKFPGCEVVPEIAPLARSKAKPCGSAPLETCQLYGPTPPVAARAALYGFPAVPPGSELVCMDNCDPGLTVTSEVATEVLSAALVAVTLTLVEEDTFGAVNKPVPVIVPPLVCHTTAVLLVEVSVAANWSCAPDATFALVGDTLSWTAGLLADEFWAPDAIPAHPMQRLVRVTRTLSAITWLRSRVGVLLVRKPGDDSKNMFALTDLNFSQNPGVRSGVFTVEADTGNRVDNTSHCPLGAQKCMLNAERTMPPTCSASMALILQLRDLDDFPSVLSG